MYTSFIFVENWILYDAIHDFSGVTIGSYLYLFKVDHAETLRYWTGVLQEAEVDLTDINVMPLRQLRAEFMEHSTRKHLAKRYNFMNLTHFVCLSTV